MTGDDDADDSLLEVHPGDPPSDAELADARTAATFEAPDPDEVVPEPARELETVMDIVHVNGGARLGVVRVPPEDTIDWFLSRNRIGEWFFRDVLAADALATALPDLELSTDRHPQDFADLDWETYPSYTLDGYLARRLVGGGAYHDFLDPPTWYSEMEDAEYDEVPETYGDRADAKRLGERFVEAVFDERYDEFSVAVTYDQWCDWFRPVPAWDATHLCFDRRTRLAWVLVVTGAD